MSFNTVFLPTCKISSAENLLFCHFSRTCIFHPFYNHVTNQTVYLLKWPFSIFPPFVFHLWCRIESEENVWKLCEQVKKTRPAELSKCYAVFVSNEGRTVPLWRQKAGRGDDKVVIWVSNFYVCKSNSPICVLSVKI